MEYAIEMRNITKRFPGIVANDNITLQVCKQEVHALLGENGAGKSTLMNVLFGLYHPDEGEILINGKEAKISSPNDANDARIGMVHQHFMLVERFSALQNIVMGVEPVKGIFLNIDEAREKVQKLIDHYNFNLDPDMKIKDMTVSQQQKVEILKMLYRDNEILIFDEPTAVLTPQEIDDLMQNFKNLIEEGKSIVFISHKLNEIMRVADRCTILRRGKYIGTVDIKDTSKEQLSEMMVGRKVMLQVNKEKADPKEPVLEVKNLYMSKGTGHKNVVNNVSFNVRRGEIVCIAGIDGNGQSELVYGLTGLNKIDGGQIILNGEDVSGLSIRERNKRSLAHIPEDRHKHGLVLDYNIAENIIIQDYFDKSVSSHGIINNKTVIKRAEDDIEKYDIRCAKGVNTITRSMSGGNQQKVIVAREIERNTDFIIAVQPTRGMDVGAIESIHKHLINMRDEGKGVLLVSLEIDEVMSVPDRILVMYEGEIVGELIPEETDYQELGLYMAGAKRRMNNEN